MNAGACEAVMECLRRAKDFPYLLVELCVVCGNIAREGVAAAVLRVQGYSMDIV